MNELDGLAAAADGVDGQVAANAPQAVQAAQEEAMVMTMADTNGRAVAGVLEMAAPLIEPLYPSVAAVYTPDVCAQVGGALGPVLAKYGIDLGEWGGKYKEELTALFVCVPVALATVKAIKEDIAARTPAEPGEGGAQAGAAT
ncbi:hypothetical protein [Duganella sp. BuS-21]|uniref:hypothetical protein n=1 Tax=Duganella sp. BuS-21 TaxID=2943848 RepID=UPI0035A5E676